MESYHTDMKQRAHISEISGSIKGEDLTFLASDPVKYFVPVSLLVVIRLVVWSVGQYVSNIVFMFTTRPCCISNAEYFAEIFPWLLD